MVASTVSSNTCVYPLRGRRVVGLFAVKMGALLSTDTHTHMSDTAGITVPGEPAGK